MSFTGNFTATSFKAEVLQKLHDFTLTTGDVFKIALYDNNASFTAATTVYTTDNEVTGTNYVAGGAALTNVTPVTSGTSGIGDFEDYTFTNVTLSARGAQVYNSTEGNRTVLVLDFGSLQTRTAANLIITFPPADASNAIVLVK
jgi:hypothetical protein